MFFGSYTPLVGAVIFTLSSSVVAIGVYEIVRHRDFQAFITTPVGKILAMAGSGSMLLFILFSNVNNEGSWFNVLRSLVQGSYFDTLKSQVQASYTDIALSYLRSQLGSVVAAGAVGIAAIFVNYLIS